MPSPNYVDTSPIPYKGRPTALEGLASGFAQTMSKNYEQKREADALKDIYAQYEADDNNLDTMLKAVNVNPTLSNATKVKTASQIMEMKKYNTEKMKTDAKTAKEEKLAEEKRAEEARTKKNKADQVADIETRENLLPGSLQAYQDNPALALQVVERTKEKVPKTGKSTGISPEDQVKIDQIEDREDFKIASFEDKQKILRHAGIKKADSDYVMQSYPEASKIDAERNKQITIAQAKTDVAFATKQAENQKTIAQHQQVLDAAADLNKKGVTGKPWDAIMTQLGLVQYTSDGYRVFSSLAKDAVKNSNIKATIGSQISQMEFGFFRDATINPNFRKEANDAIIKKEGLALRYEKLYADITEQVIAENKGVIPERLEAKVNERFADQSQKLSLEVKKEAARFNAIQHVPKGHTLMFDDKGNPLHVPNNEVAKYTELGASS